MKLKYYMRGLGIGILVTTLVLSLASKKEKLSDKEIISKAIELGMVMKDDNDDQLKEVLENSLDKEEPEKDLLEDTEHEPSDELNDEVYDESEDDLNNEPDDELVDEVNNGSDDDLNNELDDEDALEPTIEETPSNDDGEASEPNDEDSGAEVLEPSNDDEELDNQEPTNVDQVTFTILKGMSSRQISELLVEKGLIDDAIDFDYYIMRLGKTRELRAGTYTLPKDSSYQEILDAIIK